MELKITTLIENQPDDKGELAFEHGLSLFIEFAGKRLLFDTGQTGAFADNARKLGIDLSRLDAVILSHGHYDHSGGLARLLPLLAPGTPLYVGEGFFRPKYKRINLNISKDCTIPGDLKNPGGSFQYNGNPFPREILAPYQVALRQLGTDTTWLTPKIVIFKGFEKSCPFEQPNPRFYTEYGSGLQPDAFDDEIALGLLTGKGLVFLSGCAHPGILNMLHTAAARSGAPLYAVIGGTHLVEAGEARLQKTAAEFRKLGLSQIAVSHCTGAEGESLLQKTFPSQFIRNNTGHICVL